MAPKVTNKRRLVGDSFAKSGKISYNQNYLENPLGEWEVKSLNRSNNTASFLSTEQTAVSNVSWARLLKRLFLYSWPILLYKKKVISVHLKSCSSREMDTSRRGK